MCAHLMNGDSKFGSCLARLCVMVKLCCEGIFPLHRFGKADHPSMREKMLVLSMRETCLCSIDLHTQAADSTIVSKVDQQRVERLREAAASMFGPLNTSRWDLLAGGMPFLLPILQKLAPIFPDEPLVRIVIPPDSNVRGVKENKRCLDETR